jgi:hypothetical protein
MERNRLALLSIAPKAYICVASVLKIVHSILTRSQLAIEVATSVYTLILYQYTNLTCRGMIWVSR